MEKIDYDDLSASPRNRTPDFCDRNSLLLLGHIESH